MRHYPYRRRRSAWWWFLLVVLLVIAGALVVNSREAEIRREAAFFDETRTLAQEVDQVAAGYRRLVTTELRGITRDDFEALMDRLGKQMAQHSSGLKEVDAPGSAQAAREMLDIAFESWAAGLDEFRVAVTEVVDDPTGAAPVARLGGAIVHLRVGDLMYGRFLDAANALIEESDVRLSEVPSIVFISDHRVLLDATGLARTIRSSTQMGVRRDVVILQVVFDPLASGGLGEDGERIFPVTDQLQFSAVIGNRGNVDQKGLVVRAGVISEAGEVLTTIDSHTVDLAPGDVGSVLFPPTAVDPGAEYLLRFNLTVLEDEVDTQDNVWESQIRINPPG